jgi:hypothetical protein
MKHISIFLKKKKLFFGLIVFLAFFSFNSVYAESYIASEQGINGAWWRNTIKTDDLLTTDFYETISGFQWNLGNAVIGNPPIEVNKQDFYVYTIYLSIGNNSGTPPLVFTPSSLGGYDIYEALQNFGTGNWSMVAKKHSGSLFLDETDTLGNASSGKYYALVFVSTVNLDLSIFRGMTTQQAIDRFYVEYEEDTTISSFPTIPSVIGSGINFETPIISPVDFPYTFTGTYDNTAGYTKMKFNFYSQSNGLYISRFFDLAPVSGLDQDFIFNISSPPGGLQDWYAELINNTSSSVPFSPSREIMGTLEFVLSSGIPATLDNEDIDEAVCTPVDSDLYCTFKKILVWAFMPTQETAQKYAGLYDIAMLKIPFVYFAISQDFFTELFTPVASSDLPTIGIDTAIGHIDIFTHESFEIFPMRNFMRDILKIATFATFFLYIRRRILLFTNTNDVSA